MYIREKWYQNNIGINNIFTFQVAFNIIRNYEDLKPQNVEECTSTYKWLVKMEKSYVDRFKLINEKRSITYNPKAWRHKAC